MLSSPSVLHENGVSYRFYYNEGTEPPHVHAVKAEHEAKFWLAPFALCFNHGFNPAELKRISKRIESDLTFFVDKWNETQNKTIL